MRVQLSILFLAASALVASVPVYGQRAFAKNDRVVVKIPTAVLTMQFSPWSGTRYEVRIQPSSGGLEVGGRTDWRVAGFPSLFQRKITAIEIDRRTGITTVELKSDVPSLGREVKLLIKGDLNAALAEVLAAPADEERARAEGYAALSGRFFIGPLADLPDSTKSTLLSFADVVANGTTIGSSTFKEKLYLVVDLGTDDNVYNELKLNQSQRVARVMNDRLLAILKAFANQIQGIDRIHGLKLELSIPHKSFANEYASAEHDKLELYVSSADAKKFAEADITSQQLVDASVVIVNSNRIQVPLAQ